MDFIIFISILSLVGVFLPLIGSDFWLIRGQDYFKQVYLFLHLLLIIIIVINNPSGILERLVLLGLVISVIYCLQMILPFTPLSKKEIIDLKEGVPGNTLDLFVFNVLQNNNNYNSLIKLIRDNNPDVILLIETNNDWDLALLVLSDEYPYSCKELKENTYGMMLLSRIPFDEKDIRYLVREDVPSIQVSFKFNKRIVQLYSLHPKPPLPSELLRARPKDREIFKTTLLVNALDKDDLVIIAGDLNDVAWSKASLRLKRMTGLGDPRRGRGLFSTFPSYFPIKIPIDQIFCSREWELQEFKILEHIGSDHLPLNIKLSLP